MTSKCCGPIAEELWNQDANSGFLNLQALRSLYNSTPRQANFKEGASKIKLAPGKRNSKTQLHTLLMKRQTGLAPEHV